MDDGAGCCCQGLTGGVGLSGLVRHEKTVLDAIEVCFEVRQDIVWGYSGRTKIGRASCAQSANSHTTNDALNNLAAATAADRQAATNQAEAVANLTVSNQNLAQQLQQAQQQLQNMMTTMHSPTTVPGGGYRAPPPLAAPIAPPHSRMTKSRSNIQEQR